MSQFTNVHFSILRRILVAGIVAASVAISALPTYAQMFDNRVFAPQTKPFGKTYVQWTSAWWNWAVQFPVAVNPLLDDTGANGALGQSGPVWFLAGNFGGTTVRSLRIPADTALFFPIVNSIFWVPEDGATEAEVRALANANVNGATIVECFIDGKPVKNLSQFRFQSPTGGFVLHVADGSLLTDFGYSAGDRNPAVTDGFWVMVKPLSSGRHTIRFHGVFGDPMAPDFEVDVTYNLRVSQ
jgi:hypothetical protein